ncbi:hypothetical protein P781_06785 [Vibrio mimicus CAIM 1883]|nr:hypothetical protein P781_06785 [Vibrio mimicus CAIM 1883]
MSIGAVLFDTPFDYGEALRKADRAMYQAKEQGRNRVMVVQMAHSA